MAPPWLLLATGEPYQPARIYYQLHQSVAALIERFQSLGCLVPGGCDGQWLWQFEAEAQQLKFECGHSQLQLADQPVALGQWEILGNYDLPKGQSGTRGQSAVTEQSIVTEQTIVTEQPMVTLTVFSLERLLQAIPFFDRHIARTIMTASRIRLVNYLVAPSEVEQPLGYGLPLENLLEGDHIQASRADEVLAKVQELSSLASNATERMLEITRFLETVAQEPRPAVEELPVNFYEDGIISLEMIVNTRCQEAIAGWGDRN